MVREIWRKWLHYVNGFYFDFPMLYETQIYLWFCLQLAIHESQFQRHFFKVCYMLCTVIQIVS